MLRFQIYERSVGYFPNIIPHCCSKISMLKIKLLLWRSMEFTKSSTAWQKTPWSWLENVMTSKWYNFICLIVSDVTKASTFLQDEWPANAWLFIGQQCTRGHRFVLVVWRLRQMCLMIISCVFGVQGSRPWTDWPLHRSPALKRCVYTGWIRFIGYLLI